MYTRALMLMAALAAGTTLSPRAAHAQTLTTIYSFTGGNDGGYPNWLVFHDGTLYGTAGYGSSINGIVFKINLATGQEAPLYNFQGGMDGSFPTGLYFTHGLLYGITGAGGGAGCTSGVGCGTLFEVNPESGAETVLYQFSPDSSLGGTGAYPNPVIIDEHGTLYGSTEIGGDHYDCGYGCGTLFGFDIASGTETPLYDFDGSNGYGPAGVINVGGTLYGTTDSGGASGRGTLFAYDTSSNQESTLYNFGGTCDGSGASGKLIFRNGVLYGAMAEGGSANCIDGCGALFAYDIAQGTYSVIYNFAGGGFTHGSDGSYPYGPSILYGHTIYGTTQYGGGAGCGGAGCGTVFAYDIKTKAETVLYRFTGGGDGSSPYGLIFHGGSLYGVTQGGLAQGFGTVFKLTL